MKVTSQQSVRRQGDVGRQSCGRADCACALPIGERFVLWAIRQWQHDRTLPTEGSALHGGFKVAGVLDALPDFAIAMDALFFGPRRILGVHLPTCSQVSRDEATIVALCGLAQGDHDGPLGASLDVLVVPSAARVAAERLKSFTATLGRAGLRLAPPAGEAGALIN
ncbi:hypothetical protein [Enhydrobacter sp.]|jgi:hypothetical protein|uniref:hypothetical protein n=1 Tax=Enhydrobacter sp. TaxID=1894999 RepID=UPI002604FAD5|nr:hypothetical protein [Enhydrobacter sp.]WIM10663.1 MAG: hypothetical protein OJF58_001619 [Enhydrobacter sp.]